MNSYISFSLGGINKLITSFPNRHQNQPKHPTLPHLLTPINPIPILLPKRQQPTRPLPSPYHLRLRRPMAMLRIPTGRSAIQLRERHRPRRHWI